MPRNRPLTAPQSPANKSGPIRSADFRPQTPTTGPDAHASANLTAPRPNSAGWRDAISESFAPLQPQKAVSGPTRELHRSSYARGEARDVCTNDTDAGNAQRREQRSPRPLSGPRSDRTGRP